jgi:FdhE protein
MLHGIVGLWQEVALPHIQPPDVSGPSSQSQANDLRLPRRDEVFSLRAARLRQLARSNVMKSYLGMMGRLAAAQQRVLDRFEGPPVMTQRVELAMAHSMPPLQAPGAPRDPAWCSALSVLLGELARGGVLPADMREIVATLADAVRARDGWLDTVADDLLAGRAADIDYLAAPCVVAALQVFWTDQACRVPFDTQDVAHLHGLCPICGCQPVAGVLRSGKAGGQDRYLACSLCGSQWLVQRAGCTRCDMNGAQSWWQDTSQPASVTAQVCDLCRSYRKFFDEDMDAGVEPVADDLATLLLDLRLSDEGYRRSGTNLLLWEEAPHGG